MHGPNGESPQVVRTGGGPRGRRRSRPAVTATALALLTVIGVAGCQGHASSAAGGAASTPAASSPGASGAGHSPAAAPVPLSWSAARAPLPADASGVSGQYVQLSGVSCVDVRDCVAVGSNKAGGGVFHGLVETLSGGAWTPTALPDVSSKAFVSLSSVSCPAQGNCVAVGGVNSDAGRSVPVIETLAGGAWAPVKPPLPGDADTTASAFLDDVTCTAAGSCVATGWYGTQGGIHGGYVDTLANGTWTAAGVQLPGDAAPEDSSSQASTYPASVACPQAGTCVAAGQYRDDSGQVRPFTATLAGGTWTAVRAPLPADAAATGQNGSLWAVACPAPGACIAGGHYLVSGGQPRYLADTQSGGAWTAAALPLPEGAAADQKWSQDQSTTIGAVACESVGACVATAGYLSKANAILPVIATLSDGTWTVAAAPLPADAVPGSGQANAAYLQLVTCPTAGHCLAVGSYPAADGTVESMIEMAVPR